MAEPATAEFSVYGQNESEGALTSRQQLPVEVQLALPNVLHELCLDPKDYPADRLRPIDRSGKTLLYQHDDPPVQVTFELDEEAHMLYFMHYASVAVPVRKKVFVSYAREDGDVLAEIEKALAPLEELGLIELWDDTRIKAGDKWLEVLEKELAAARMALLLVSSHFAASEFIAEEELPTILAMADDQGVRLLWVALSAGVPLNELGLDEYQGLNNMEKPLEGLKGAPRKAEYKKIYKQIEQLVKA